MENLDLLATKWLLEHGWDRARDGAVWISKRSSGGGGGRVEKWKLDAEKDGDVVAEYQRMIMGLREKVGGGDEWKIKNWMKELKWDQKYISDMVRGVIRFKRVSDGGGCCGCGIEEWFDVWGCVENVKLGIKWGMIRSDDEVLVLWGDKDSTLESIGKKLGITAQAVSRRIERRCRKLWKEEMKKRLYWKCTYEVKGDWRECIMCGEVKLGSEFAKGRNRCRKCDSARHRGGNVG